MAFSVAKPRGGVLTNDELHHFDPKRRIKVGLKDLKLEIVDLLFADGDAYSKELESTREVAKRKADARKAAGGGIDR